MKRIACLLMVFMLTLTACQKGKDENEKPLNSVKISVQSQQIAGIQTRILELKSVSKIITAPGEVIPNADLSSTVTPRVSAQVVKRLVQVGQVIKIGQPLVVLSSVDMAKAQGDALMAAQEWERLKQLGKEAVSAKRYNEAEINFQHVSAKLIAYGMTSDQVDALLNSKDSKKATGEFELLAPRDGTIFKANAAEGEIVEPGKLLFDIVNGSAVWIDAKLSPVQAKQVLLNSLAWINIEQQKFSGKVIQVHPQLDETTRTQTIRIEVPDANNNLRPGQFVECEIAVGQTPPVLAVPTEAILRSGDGDAVMYVEIKPDYFQQQEIKQVDTIGNQSIIEGIKPGSRVVTKGAFFVHSELNKGDIQSHGH